MKREFLINILILVGINLLVKPIYIFGIEREVQNVVGVHTYGVYFAVFNFTFLLQIVNDFGIHTFNNRHIAQHRGLLNSYFPNVLTLKMILAAIYIGIVVVVAYFSGYTARQYFGFLWWLCLIHILNSLILYLRSNISGLGWYRTDSWLSSLSKFLMIVVCGILLYSPTFRDRFTIEWFIYAQVSTLMVTALVAVWLVRKKLSWGQWSLERSFLWRILKESYPYALAIFLMTVYTRIDAVMIERMLPDGQVEAGIYAAAYRLLDASNMIGFLFAGLLLPMFARMLKEGESVSQLLVFSFQLIMAGAIALAIPTYFYKGEIMIWLYDEGTLYWGAVLGHLILSFIAGCVIYIYSPLLTANESLAAMNKVFVIGVVLNVLLNAWMIPINKAMGAAIATLITQCFIAVSLVVLAVKFLRLNIHVGMTARVLGYAAGVFGICYLVSRYWAMPWTMQFLVIITLAVMLAFLLRLISIRTLFERIPV